MKSLKVALLISTFSLASRLYAQAPAASLDSGIVYEQTTTTKVEGMAMMSVVTRTRHIESPRGIREETLERSGMPHSEAAAPFTPSTDRYTLTLADGNSFSIDTVRKEYYQLDLHKLFDKGSPFSSMMSSMNMKMSRSKASVEDLGAGEPVAGHPTHHWKLHSTMTMTMVANGDTVATVAEIFSDNYYANDVHHVATEALRTTDAPDSAMMAFAKGFVGDSAEAAAIAKKLPKTIPLKRLDKISMTMGPMDFLTTNTTEVTKLERRKFDASLFEIPRGYKKVEMPLPASPVKSM